MLKPVHTFIAFLIVVFATIASPGVLASTVFQQGAASYYGKAHHGKRTASGERFNMHAMTAAHRTLPFGTKLRITSKDTGKSVLVTVNDRGPYKGRRILDLSQEAARRLGMIKIGVGQVTIEKISPPEVKRPRLEPVEFDMHDDVYKQIDPLANLIASLDVQ